MDSPGRKKSFSGSKTTVASGSSLSRSLAISFSGILVQSTMEPLQRNRRSALRYVRILNWFTQMTSTSDHATDICYKPDAYLSPEQRAAKVEAFNRGYCTVSDHERFHMGFVDGLY
jgi:hypothetical protein